MNFRISKNHVIEMVIFSALVFNFILAIINGFIPLTSNIVAVVDGFIILFSTYLIVTSNEVVAKKGLLFIIVFVLPCLFVVAMNFELNPKYFRDALIIPVFTLLGFVYNGSFKLFLKRCVIVVLVFMVLEAVWVDVYTELVNIKQYYINTRGVFEDGFYTVESNLFVNAYRPGERFISIPNWDLHRVSSVFLEPVSMGNFAIFIAILLLSAGSWFSRSEKIFFFIAWLLVVIFSDSRFAFLTSLIIVFLYFLPQIVLSFSVFVTPVVLVLSVFLATYFGWEIDDSFQGRVAETAVLLLDSHWSQFLTGDLSVKVPVDSGYTYIVYTQSVFFLFLIMFLIFGYGRQLDNLYFHKYKFNLAVYLSLSLLISCSLFSIKTASLFFFTYGVLASRTNFESEEVL
jgi:putative polymerase